MLIAWLGRGAVTDLTYHALFYGDDGGSILRVVAKGVGLQFGSVCVSSAGGRSALDFSDAKSLPEARGSDGFDLPRPCSMATADVFICMYFAC